MADQGSNVDLVVACIPKNSNEELRVILGTFNGHEIVHLRVWYDAGDGEMRPTKKGVAFRRDMLPDVIEALAQAERLAGEGGGS